MNRKAQYKDAEKWRKTCRAQKARYYGKSRAGAFNKYSPWTVKEINKVMAHSVTDSELAQEIGRSVGSIQVMRAKVKSGQFSAWEKRYKKDVFGITAAFVGWYCPKCGGKVNEPERSCPLCKERVGLRYVENYLEAGK